MKFHCGSVYKFSKTIGQAIHEEFPQRGERERNVNFYSMDKQEAYNGEGIFDTRVKLGNYESFRHGILGQRSLNLELLPMMLSLPQ